MQPGRILLDLYVPPSEQWCWRADWYVPGESAWTLMAKFALLNRLTAREIAGLVISRRSRKRSVHCTKPEVDLRDPAPFDLEILAGMLRVQLASVRTAFLYETLPGTVLRSSEWLRWCRQCMAQGFHTPLFQMHFTRTCPLHHSDLLERCERCQRAIPYQLNTALLAKPFHCPHCGFDLSPTMALPRPQFIILRLEDLERLALLRKFHRSANTERITADNASSLITKIKNAGVIFSTYDEAEIECQYAGFMVQVLRDVPPITRRRQKSLRLEPVAKYEYGNRDPESWSDDDPGGEELPPTSAHAYSRPSDSEYALEILLETYKSIRRKLWRGLLREHQRCIRSAAARMWWRADGCCTVGFCPQALAFIRWRMLWEGCGTPRYLFARPEKDLFGILAWHLSRPSPTPVHWSGRTKAWVENHIFATTCLESFGQLTRWSEAACQSGDIVWERLKSPINRSCLWAIAGQDCRGDPTRVYVRQASNVTLGGLALPAGRNHWKAHRAQIAQLVR